MEDVRDYIRFYVVAFDLAGQEEQRVRCLSLSQSIRVASKLAKREGCRAGILIRNEDDEEHLVEVIG